MNKLISTALMVGALTACTASKREALTQPTMMPTDPHVDPLMYELMKADSIGQNISEKCNAVINDPAATVVDVSSSGTEGEAVLAIVIKDGIRQRCAVSTGWFARDLHERQKGVNFSTERMADLGEKIYTSEFTYSSSEMAAVRTVKVNGANVRDEIIYFVTLGKDADGDYCSMSYPEETGVFRDQDTLMRCDTLRQDNEKHYLDGIRAGMAHVEKKARLDKLKKSEAASTIKTKTSTKP